jgi:hypothetical protein
MGQGLSMIIYGSMLFLCLKVDEVWLGDTQMYGGTLSFLAAFLGFFGREM